MQQTWFYGELYAETNSFESNRHLRRTVGTPFVTFEQIRRCPDWSDTGLRILRSEVQRDRSTNMRSTNIRTTNMRSIYRAYMERMVEECWAKPILAKVARKWVARHYAPPNGKGYKNAKYHFTHCGQN